MMTRQFPHPGFSHVLGRRDLPLLDDTIPQLLARTARDHGTRDAAIFGQQDVRLSYAAFQTQVDQLASGFLSLGLRKGDRVGIWSPNRVEWLLTQFATARAGLILVCINPAYRPGELEYALNKVGCKAIVTAQRFKSSDYLAMLGQVTAPQLEHVIAMGRDLPDGMIAFDTLCQTPPDLPALDAIEIDQTDVINIQFTSGTTGAPKGAALTHRNIVNNAHFVMDALEITRADRICIPVPFYHCFGMVMGTLGCVTRGAAMVIPSEGFEPAATLQSVAAERCTALYGVPTMFVAMLDHPEFSHHDLSSLRTGIMAGAPCPIKTMQDVQSRMHMTGVTIAYGMTETAPVSFQSNVDDPLEQRVSSVGRIHPHVEVKIVDEAGATVPIGEQGELLTKGYSVMHGYWNDTEKTSESIIDGWMHTGDLGVLDPDGYCTITGRLKDMICRGGENIFPKEIEDFLFTHPDVAQAQVFGIPDDTYGEVTCAWVIPKPAAKLAEADIQDFCKGTIAHFKVPTHVRIVEDWPMTVTGKPQKFQMAKQMTDELAREAL